jgi:hypothetical protein
MLVVGFTMSNANAFPVEMKYHTSNHWVVNVYEYGHTSGPVLNKAKSFVLDLSNNNVGFSVDILYAVPLVPFPFAVETVHYIHVNPGDSFDIYQSGYLTNAKIVQC